MTNSLYSKEVIEHFTNPQHWGKLKDADGVGDTKNIRCGDLMTIYIKMGQKDDQEIIKDISFETLGCAAAVATSDMICQIALGKTLEQAKKITFQDIEDQLGELPPMKIHCAHLAETALKEAIKDYENKKE